jgi:predicted ATPase
MKIQSIEIKKTEIIELGNFTLFVGPNNVGKSQALKDINSILTFGHETSTEFITKIKIDAPKNYEEMVKGLNIQQHPTTPSLHTIDEVVSWDEHNNSEIQVHLEGLKQAFNPNHNTRELDYTFQNLSKFRVYYMNSDSRLNITKTTPSIDPRKPPRNLMHKLYRNDSIKKKLNNAFQQAFHMDIFLDYSTLVNTRFVVDKDLKNMPDKNDDILNRVGKLPSLEKQGDGYRSFTATVLTLLLSEDKVILIDEPEAFLHPEQARILGAWIAENFNEFKSQILITTHSSNFLQGLLSKGESELKIHRLNRIEDITTFTEITTDNILKLSKSPILSSQRVLDSIFSTGVVVCESDADRIFYNTIATNTLNVHHILFIHAHSKQIIKDVVELLNDISVPVAGIVDIDILNGVKDLANLLSKLNIKKELLDEIRNKSAMLNQLITEISDEQQYIELLEELTNLSDEIKNKKHTNFQDLKSALKRVSTSTSKWKDIKKNGINGFKTKEQKSLAENIIDLCKTKGIFIVQKGELESWISIDGVFQKKDWILPALEKVNKNQNVEEVTIFIKDILKYLNSDI